MSKPVRPLYFDTAATTVVAPEVLACMVEVLAGVDANPSSSSHLSGQIAAERVALARQEIATELGCDVDEIIFTSGATEANNLALQGIAQAYAAQGRHLITSAIEHKSVLECCNALMRAGFDITLIQPNRNGWVAPNALAGVIRPDTLLISIQHINNETGVIQPIAELAEEAAQAGVLFHVDAAQSAGKFKINLQELPIDLLSLSAHKFHGPKGIGCLVVRDRRRLHLQPILYGGGQEFGLRPGTLPTHQIVGMANALTLAAKRRTADLAHVGRLKECLLSGLREKLVMLENGEPTRTSPYIANIAIDGIIGEALINQLRTDLAISSGSACSSGTVEASPVLRAMGIEGEPLYGAVRLSFSRDHTEEDIAFAVDRIVAAVSRMKELD